MLNAEEQLIFAMCNGLGVRILHVTVGLGLILGGSALLHRALKGKIKRIMLFRVIVEGSDANLGAGCFATLFLLLGLVILVAAILRLDC